MGQPSPLAVLSTLLGVTISTVRRLAVVSNHGRITLASTLALGVDQRYVVLSYSQQGLGCLPPASREDLRWDVELEDDEWLELADLEADAVLPALPLTVDRIDGWVGYGRYDDVFAVAFENQEHQLVVTTTSDVLVCTTLEIARDEAELVARNSGLRLRQETLTAD